MQAIETLLANLANSQVQPCLAFVKGQSGLDLYGPIEDLFPELRERVNRAPSEIEIFADAIARGEELIVRDGRRARRVTRDRISAFIDVYGETSGLAKARRDICNQLGGNVPTLVLGLRLSNRCPSDMLGLYSRLVKSLTEKHGPMVVIVDGINSGDDPTKAAALIYNCLLYTSPSPRDVEESRMPSSA